MENLSPIWINKKKHSKVSKYLYIKQKDELNKFIP